MKVKSKIMLTVAMMVLVLSVMAVGVWAAITKTKKLSFSSTIAFTGAQDVKFNVAGAITGAGSVTKSTWSKDSAEEGDFNNSGEIQDSETRTWNAGTITFTNTATNVVITFDITSEETESGITVTLTDTSSLTNCTATWAGITAGTAETITAGGTKQITCTLAVTDKSVSASGTLTFNLAFTRVVSE